MAFDDVVFPTVPLIHDQIRETIDPVSVASNGSYEYRTKRQIWERFVYRISTQTMTTTQKEQIRNFLLARGHGLNSFKYHDPELSLLQDAVLDYNSGTEWNLALPLDSTTAGTHPLFNLDETGSPALSVTVDGSPGTLGSISVISGQPVITVSGTTGTEVVKLSGNAYFTVRLDSNFSETLQALNTSNRPIGHVVNEIRLVEVFGEY